MSTAGSSAIASDPSRGRRALGLAVMLTGSFVTVLDAFIVFVTMPAIRHGLGASFGQAALVIAGYNLTFAAGLVTGGRLGDIYGHRRLFLIALACFTLTSGLCGLATSADALILFRLAQGLSSSLLVPQVFSIMRLGYENPAERRSAFAWMGVAIGSASVLGQLLGGLILAADIFSLGWRPIFLLNIPVGIAALLAGRAVPGTAQQAGQKLDVSGALLSGFSLALLLYPLIAGPEAGWPIWLVAMFPLSFVMALAFIAVQRRKSRDNASPLLDTALLSDKAFVLGGPVILLFYAGISPFMLSFSYLLQQGLGRTALQAALDFSPLAIALSAASMMIGRFVKGDGRMALIGGALTCLTGYSLIALATWSGPLVSAQSLLLPITILGAGQGMIMTPVVNVLLSRIDPAQTGSAAGVLAMMQRAGSALGIAVLGMVFAAQLKFSLAQGRTAADAYGKAFGSVATLSAMMMVVVTILLLRLPARSDPFMPRALVDG